MLFRKNVITLFAACCMAAASMSSASGFNECEQEGKEVHVLISTGDDVNVPKDLHERLADLDRSGLTCRVLHLQSTGSKVKAGMVPGFKNFTIVDFIDEDAYQTWMQSGRKNLNSKLRVRRADVIGHDADTMHNSDESKFVVSHYESLVSRMGYQSYTDDYIVPNMMHQRWSGIMSRWTMYFEREPSGEKANAVLLMEYKDAKEYARRDGVKGAYKSVLVEHNPKWAHINSVKHTEIRKDVSESYAVKVNLD